MFAFRVAGHLCHSAASLTLPLVSRSNTNFHTVYVFEYVRTTSPFMFLNTNFHTANVLQTACAGMREHFDTFDYVCMCSRSNSRWHAPGGGRPLPNHDHVPHCVQLDDGNRRGNVLLDIVRLSVDVGLV